MVNKYAEELIREKNILKDGNPFSNKKVNKKTNNFNFDDSSGDIPFMDQKSNNVGYFSLLLDPSYADLELKIRGYRKYIKSDGIGGEKVIFKKVENHYLNDEGAEDMLSELSFYLGSDIKLGVLTVDEFKATMDIIRKFTISYISNNMHKLGMDTEEKQRKATQLINMLLIRIRQVMSRSIAGKENERSHGDLKLSGEIDFQKEERFNMGDIKN